MLQGHFSKYDRLRKRLFLYRHGDKNSSFLIHVTLLPREEMVNIKHKKTEKNHTKLEPWWPRRMHGNEKSTTIYGNEKSIIIFKNGQATLQFVAF